MLDRVPPVTVGRPSIAGRLALYAARVESALRGSPQVAAALDKGAAVWSKLVDAFCATIDPLIVRLFPDLRLVAVETPGGAVRLHKVTRSAVEDIGTLAEFDPGPSPTKWSAIELRLRPDQVMQRTLTLPGAGREFLDPIIEHRLERLTPWRPERVLYGYGVETTTSSDVTVVLTATSRDIVQDTLRQLADLNLEPTAIGLDEGPLETPLRVNLRRDRLAKSASDSRRVVSRVAIFVLAGLLVTSVVSAFVASNAADARDQAATNLLKARRMLKSATMADVGSREKALLDAKTPDRAVVALVDKLAKAIPQDTYLRELAVTPGKVRIVGSTTNAPALIGEIQGAGLTNARFTSPVTREKDQRDTFEITAERPGAPAEADKDNQ